MFSSRVVYFFISFAVPFLSLFIIARSEGGAGFGVWVLLFCSFLSLPVLIFEFNLLVYISSSVYYYEKTKLKAGAEAEGGFLFPFFPSFLSALLL